MNDEPQIPTALKVVAILFIVGGVLAVLEILVSLMHSRISFNFGVLGLFIGPGLLGLRPGWRTCALVFVWFGMIGIPVIALVMLGHSAPIHFKVFGQTVGYVPKGLALTLAAVWFMVALWQYCVLTRPDVRALFGLETR